MEMRRLDAVDGNSFRVNSRKDFIRNGILMIDDVELCFDFAYGMTFGRTGAHRDHRSGGQNRRSNGEIFINTFQGKISEYALFNYVTRVEGVFIDPPDLEMMDLSFWDMYDLRIGDCTINVKSTKKRGNLLLLETADWDLEGNYIPNLGSEGGHYDYFLLVRVDPDGEKLLRDNGLLYAESVDRDLLHKVITSVRWHVNLTGYISSRELVEDVILKRQILPRGAVLNGYTVMDAENYYVQAGDLHDISGLINEIAGIDDGGDEDE